MDTASWLRDRILGLTVVSFGAGAALAVAVVGIPRLWSAEAAGWASAIVTFAAVVVALVTAHRQLNHAREAVAAERETAEAVQQREWDASEVQRRLTTIRLAFVFSRELGYARRRLATRLLDWHPDRIAYASRDVLSSFANPEPLGRLELIETFADRLDGFNDEDAFTVLTVLATWNFFDGPQAITVDECVAMRPETRAQSARMRLVFGFELMDVVDRAINQLAGYYQDHPSITGSVSQEPPAHVNSMLRAIREAL